MMYEYQIAHLKSILLSGSSIALSDTLKSQYSSFSDNHHHKPWMFLRLSSTSRVRLIVKEDNPAFYLDYDDNNFISIYDYKSMEKIVDSVLIEDAIIHSPQQLFFGIYENCIVGCQFCPLCHIKEEVHYSLNSIFTDIKNASDCTYNSIGITTGMPSHLSSDDVADEMIFIVRKIVEKVGDRIPIGVSTKIPSYAKMKLLKETGASEIRLNMEVPDEYLAKKLMPNKFLPAILDSIEQACCIFGKGKVSSNIILGLGENDNNVLRYVDKLASIGAIATLYPYDPIESNNKIAKTFLRPTPDRLYYLAVEHKRILEKYKLNPKLLNTMCPGCAASHIFPGKDL